MKLGLSLSLCFLALSSVAYFRPSFAGDSNNPFCNGRRVFGGAQEIIAINPNASTDCYIYLRKIIRKASGYNTNLGEAEGVVETLLILKPESAYPRIGLAELEMKKLELKRHARPLYEIYREARSATQIEPLVADAFITLGRLNLLRGCLICADTAAQKASDLDASNPELAMLKSSIEEERNNVPGARAILVEALASQSSQLTPEIEIEMRLNISLLYAIEKNYLEAERGYDKAIDINPGNPAPYIARARMFLVKGDPQAAIQAAHKSNKVKITVAGKRLQSFAEYLSWAMAYLEGDKSGDLKELVRTSFVYPEEAFVESAQYEATSAITEALLKATVIKNFDARDDHGNTALMLASLGNNIDLVKILMENNADLNAQNNTGVRALSYLVSNGNHKATLAMLNAGVEVNYVDINGNSPLSLAVFREDQLLVRVLLAHNASLQPVIELAKQFGIEGIEEIIQSMIPASI